MNRCPECGRLDKTKFCGMCGAKLDFFMEDGPGLDKLFKKQEEKEYNGWIREMVLLPESEFQERMGFFYSNVNPDCIPELDRLFRNFIDWRKNGLPEIYQEHAELVRC